MRLLTIIFFFQIVASTRPGDVNAQLIGNEKRLLVEHNSPLLIRRVGSPQVLMISITPDQLLSSSRAYVQSWKCENLTALIQLFKLNQKMGVIKPDSVDMNECNYSAVNSFGHLNVHGIRFTWVGGNRKSSWLKAKVSANLEVLAFSEICVATSTEGMHFEPWEKYLRRNNEGIYQKSSEEIVQIDLEKVREVERQRYKVSGTVSGETE